MANPNDGSQTADSQGEGQQPGQEIAISNGSDIAVQLLKVHLSCPSRISLGDNLETALELSIDPSIGGLHELYENICANPQNYGVSARVSFKNCKARANVDVKINFRDYPDLFRGKICRVDMPILVARFRGDYALVGSVDSSFKLPISYDSTAANVSEAKVEIK
jgi:hypothetical protein